MAGFMGLPLRQLTVRNATPAIGRHKRLVSANRSSFRPVDISYELLAMPNIDAHANVEVGGRKYAVQTVALGPEVPEFKCLEPTEALFLYKQIFEEADYTQFGISIGANDVVCDIGANIGAFAVYAALKGASVYAFEPVSILSRICNSNLELYIKGDAECKVFTMGLTAPEKVGTVEFDFFPQYSLLSSSHEWDLADRDAIAQKLLQFEGSNDPTKLKELRRRVQESLTKEVVQAQLRTFAEVRKELGLQRIDLLKIDVEKAEWDVVCGISDEDWAMTRQVAIETHVIGDRVAQVEALLRAKGFTNVHVGEVGVPKFLGFKLFDKLHPDTVSGGEGTANGSADANGGGLVCNIYATRD